MLFRALAARGETFVFMAVDGRPAPGYIVGPASADPASVEIIGPESAVRRATEAPFPTRPWGTLKAIIYLNNVDAYEHLALLKGEVAPGDKVLVRQRIFGRGAGSGIELNAGAWLVLTFDAEGLIARAEVFLLGQEAEALEAAALEE